MNNFEFINQIKNNKKMYSKFYFNKYFKFFYYFIPLFLILIFLMLGIVFISIDKYFLIPAVVFIILSLFMVIVFFFLSYYDKKMKNKLKADFNLKNITKLNLIETEMYDRNYLSIFHSSIDETKELKWNTKTFDYQEHNLLIRFSYIKYFEDEQKILINPKWVTQIYFQLKKLDEKSKYTVYKNKINDSKEIMSDDGSFYVKGEYKKNKYIEKIIKNFLLLDIDFNLIVDNEYINLYLLRDNNYLFVNLEEKYNEKKLINELIEFNKIIELLIN